MIQRTSQSFAVLSLIVAAALLTGCGAVDSGPGDSGHGDSGAMVDRHGDHDSHPENAGGHETTSQHDGPAIATIADGHGDAHAERPLATERRPVAVEAKIKIKTGEGAAAYSIKWKDDGAKLVDENEQELARYNVSDGGRKLKIKDPEDQVIAYLVGSAGSGRIKVEGADQETELFKLIRQDDGDWKLEDSSDKLLVRIKVRDYGAELESAADVSLYKVKARDGKTSLRDAKDKTLWYSNSPVRPLSFACLGLDVIEDVRVRAALLVQMQAVHEAQH